jgi:hypothetical protein
MGKFGVTKERNTSEELERAIHMMSGQKGNESNLNDKHHRSPSRESNQNQFAQQTSRNQNERVEGHAN